ncbi:MAG: hypothetical protein ACOH1P_03405 [Lysobacter sp.]
MKFFLADPELGLAGVYTVRGVELYFEARRSVGSEDGTPGALSLRVIDAGARTLALGGESYAKHWVPQQNEFESKDGFAYAQLLSGLGKALGAADLHVSLSAEKSALTDLALQAAGAPAGGFPVRAAVQARQSRAPDVSQVADFYQRSARGVQMTRKRDGTLEANLGNGIVFVSSQRFLANELDPDTGRMGRIEAYSMVKAADGYVLSAELGGDALPAGWADAMAKDTGRDHHALAADFGRAATALNALGYSTGRSQGVMALSHLTEQEVMHRQAKTLITDLLPVRDEAPRLTVSSGPDNQLAVTGLGLYQTNIQVWRKPFKVIAQHSGTRVGKYQYNSGTSSTKTFKGWITFCNHGGCPTGDQMTLKCTFTGPRLDYYRVPTRLTAFDGHTCSTSYAAIHKKGEQDHNCHDDSSTQVRAVRGQSYSPTTGRCNDDTNWVYAPTCDAQ